MDPARPTATTALASYPRRGTTARSRLSALALCAALSGCVGDTGVSSSDATDSTIFPDWGHREASTAYWCDTIDILFVVDNSNTMEAEQGNLATSFPELVKHIEAIDPPIQSYHLGVISTDLGAGPQPVGTCTPGGDEAILQHAPRGEGCAASYPTFLEGPGDQVAQDFSCIAQLGTGGCGYEQQLEAALKALTDQPANGGFLRDTAPLAIIFITDEDDCSAADQTLFDPNDTALGPMPTRCVSHLDKLHPVSRYVEGFKALKDQDERLVVAAITGPPGEVEIDPMLATMVKPACASPELGEATPGNRFAELVAAFGEQGIQANLCDGDLAAPLDIIGKAIERVCLE